MIYQRLEGNALQSLHATISFFGQAYRVTKPPDSSPTSQPFHCHNFLEEGRIHSSRSFNKFIKLALSKADFDGSFSMLTTDRWVASASENENHSRHDNQKSFDNSEHRRPVHFLILLH